MRRLVVDSTRSSFHLGGGGGGGGASKGERLVGSAITGLSFSLSPASQKMLLCVTMTVSRGHVQLYKEAHLADAAAQKKKKKKKKKKNKNKGGPCGIGMQRFVQQTTLVKPTMWKHKVLRCTRMHQLGVASACCCIW